MNASSLTIFLLAVLLVVFLFLVEETFQGFWISEGTRFQCPTRNMSYDIRGDIYPIQQTVYLPTSDIGPVTSERCIYRKN